MRPAPQAVRPGDHSTTRDLNGAVAAQTHAQALDVANRPADAAAQGPRARRRAARAEASERAQQPGHPRGQPPNGSSPRVVVEGLRLVRWRRRRRRNCGTRPPSGATSCSALDVPTIGGRTRCRATNAAQAAGAPPRRRPPGLRPAAHSDAQLAAELDWVSCVDSSITRAHQYAGGARHRSDPDGEGVSGRTRGPDRMTRIWTSAPGVSSRRITPWDDPRWLIHQDPPVLRGSWTAPGHQPHRWSGRGQPATARSARRHPCRHPGPGRPRQRPDRVISDKAYSHPSTRAALRRRGIRVTFPNTTTNSPPQRARPGPPVCLRPPALPAAQRRRTLLQPVQQWRGIATRYDKTARNYRGGLLLASLILWTRP